MTFVCFIKLIIFIFYLQERFAGTKLSKLVRSAIADTMMTNVWTSVAILDKCPSWIRSRMRRQKAAVGNMEHNAGTRVKCFRLKITSAVAFIYLYLL